MQKTTNIALIPFVKMFYIITLTVAKERIATQPCKLNAFFIFLALTAKYFSKMANQVIEINHMMIA